MKKRVTLVDLYAVASNRAWLQIALTSLRLARLRGYQPDILYWETAVCRALDDAWEAQQRAA